MKPENEIKAFGFIDKETANAGTWKAKAVQLIEQAEGTPLESEVVKQVAQAVKKMNMAAIVNAFVILEGTAK